MIEGRSDANEVRFKSFGAKKNVVAVEDDKLMVMKFNYLLRCNFIEGFCIKLLDI